MNTTENNKLIAEFLGYKEQKDPTERWFGRLFIPAKGWYKENELAFNHDWNWLMEVVEKIESLGFTTSFKTNYVRINPKENCSYYNHISRVTFSDNGWYVHHPYPTHNSEPDLRFIDSGKNKISKIEAVYLACVEFIKWYNENK